MFVGFFGSTIATLLLGLDPSLSDVGLKHVRAAVAV
jgi:hypothetical protein